MTNQVTMKDFDDWSTLLSNRWHADITIDGDTQKELSSFLYTIGIDEMNECIDIVAAANEPSRHARYLIGVIRRRQTEQSTGTRGPAKAQKRTIMAYVYHQCDRCLFVNKIRRDILEQHRGKMMKCGGVCNQRWLVDDILKQYERNNGNV